MQGAGLAALQTADVASALTTSVGAAVSASLGSAGSATVAISGATEFASTSDLATVAAGVAASGGVVSAATLASAPGVAVVGTMVGRRARRARARALAGFSFTIIDLAVEVSAGTAISAAGLIVGAPVVEDALAGWADAVEQDGSAFAGIWLNSTGESVGALLAGVVRVGVGAIAGVAGGGGGDGNATGAGVDSSSVFGPSGGSAPPISLIVSASVVGAAAVVLALAIVVGISVVRAQRLAAVALAKSDAVAAQLVLHLPPPDKDWLEGAASGARVEDVSLGVGTGEGWAGTLDADVGGAENGAIYAIF